MKERFSQRSTHESAVLLPYPDGDADYRRNREEAKAAAKQYVKPFGADILLDVDPALATDILVVSRGKLRQALASQSERYYRDVRFFFQEALRNTAVRNHPFIHGATRGLVGDPGTPAKLVQTFAAQDFPDDLWRTILLNHLDNYKKAAAEFETTILPEYKKKFLEEWTTFMNRPGHPLAAIGLSPELIKQRLNEVAILCADPIDLGTKGAAGEYNEERNLALLNIDWPSVSSGKFSFSYLIFRHEMIHVLAGRTVEKRNGRFSHIRCGLDDFGDHAWLNEAITETLTHEMSLKGKEWLYGSYIVERDLYKQLLKQIPEEYFLAAYFENESPEEEHGKRRPHWRALLQKVEEVYGENILETIEEYLVGYEDREKGLAELTKRFDFSGRWLPVRS
jgi:hypothetical protein